MPPVPKIVLLLFLISSVISSITLDPPERHSSKNIQQIIDTLNGQLRTKLAKKDVPFKFMRTWAIDKGLYESSIHINFLDKKNGFLAKQFRDGPIPDINMFVTTFVLYSQLQAQELGTVKINEHDFSFALQALSRFRDKNTQHGLPQYIFWPQSNQNGTWFAQPVNLVNLANIWPQNVPLPIKNYLDKHGLWMIEFVKQLVKYFTIPADNDDSAVMMALLGFMKETGSPHFQFWNSFNYKKHEFYRRLLKYAYRPFASNYSQNPNADEIDTRSYYILSQFLDQIQQRAQTNNSTPTLILPTTWLINERDSVKDLISIPLDANNVDATVCTNVLFGLSYQIIIGEINIEQWPELAQMIRDTTDFLKFVVEQKIENRPDLTLVYYPSKYDFYWFLARLVNLLRRHPDSLPQVLVYSRTVLQRAMKELGTQHILSKKQQKNDKAYWVEFIGNYAGKDRNEDALFNTVMALNCLYDTWTIRNRSQLSFLPDTPPEVKKNIQSGIQFILQAIANKQGKSSLNSFFSGSVKGFETYPYFYPANVHTVNGTNFNPQKVSTDALAGEVRYLVKGKIDKTKYESLKNLEWFGIKVPENFVGYNSMPFPFWSSDSITKAMTISVLSKRLKVKDPNSENRTF